MTVASWPDLYPAEATVDLRRLSPGDAGRLIDITLTFARHGVFVVARRGHLLVLQPHRRGPVALAVALRRSFSDLGPTFVKFGQLIASSPGLFPEVVSHEFRRLLDQLPAEPADRVRAVIESQFGVPVATLFAEFNDEPVAAASIAQVHAATLRDGTRVAVKVRRPRLTMKVERDLRLLRLLAGILQHAGTVGALANPVAIVEDFAATLRSELDFRNEGVYLAEFARNLAAGDNYQIIVPLPVEGMVSPRVLVMTYIDGTPIDDIESLRASGHDGQELLRIAVRAWIESALVHGLFHGDVHAGNLFVTSEGRVAFLDFGIMGRLDAHARDVLGHLLRALLVDADYVSAVQAVFELGVISQPIHNWADAASELGTLIEPLRTARLSDIDYGEVLGRVVHIAARYHVRLPREFVLVVKQLLYFERYSKQLAPDFRILNDPTILPLLLRPMQPGPRATPESHG